MGKGIYWRDNAKMDINGIGFCKEHEDVIRAGYIALVTGNEKLFKQLIKPYDNK